MVRSVEKFFGGPSDRLQSGFDAFSVSFERIFWEFEVKSKLLGELFAFKGSNSFEKLKFAHFLCQLNEFL